MRTDRTIRRVVNFIIGDSVDEGENQILSRDFYGNCEESIAYKEALYYAKLNCYTNLRLVSHTQLAITIPSGIIGWHTIKETIKKIKL